jgi:hypothetical protein
MTFILVNVLACHSEMSFLAIEESSLLVTQIHEISRRSYLRSVEMTSRFVNVLACHSEMSFLAIEESLLLVVLNQKIASIVPLSQ